jgi:hypothetical protein
MNTVTLAENLSSAYEKIVQTLGSLPSSSPYNLKSVSFSLVIDAAGGVSLLSAASATMKTQVGLTFTLETGSQA